MAWCACGKALQPAETRQALRLPCPLVHLPLEQADTRRELRPRRNGAAI